jgi:DNA-directed RNA polymerase specialized sigma24 family protein
MPQVPNLPAPDQPAEALAAVVALRRLAAGLEVAAVDEALGQGWTWQQIGDALGMSSQAAHKRLAPARRQPSRQERQSWH